eukprot:TRINITY_DN256_c0_g3_i1.p1 TRINITY_DN256_c0_g3~~TRINITY_DN256_c0_g3_i1.p1  ORF type:complete len:504 (+),score=123.45 TRINITY_DN256_c0_g3_i1:147-1658(+)
MSCFGRGKKKGRVYAVEGEEATKMDGPEKVETEEEKAKREAAEKKKKDEEEYIKRSLGLRLSRRLRWWNVLIFLILAFFFVWIPFQVGFHVEISLLWIGLEYVLDALLIVDIVVTFHVPFEEDGMVVTSKKRIALHYVQTYLLWDVLASFPLEIIIFLATGEYSVVFRLNKMFRLSRMSYYFDLFEKYSRMNPSVVRILKFLYEVLLMTHWVATAYFLVVYSEGSQSDAWTGNPDLLDEPVYSQYLASFYWALVTMTGYGGALPITDSETLFTLFVVLLGVAVFVTIIGTVGSLVTNLDSSASFFRQKMDTINDYMKYRRLPLELQNRVRNYYAYLWKSRKGLDESKVLEDLPPYLRMEVSLHLNREIIEKVPLFDKADPQFIAAVVMRLKPRVSLPNSYIVKKGETGKEMFFISRGSVEVVSEDGNTIFATLQEGKFFGEIALVLSGKRTASVRAATYCDLFVLTKDDFDEVLADFPDQSEIIFETAKKRYKEVRAAQEDDK